MRAWAAGLVLVFVSTACQRPAPSRESSPPPPPPRTAASPVDQARALLRSGDVEGALAKLRDAGSSPDVLCLQGVAWAKKAEVAPVPTPPPGASPARRGAQLAAPQFKAEEMQALEFFERGLAAQPGHACSSLGLADLLAPHALRRYGQQRAAAPRRGGRRPAADPPPEGAPDYRPERVIQAYRAASLGEPASSDSVEKLIDFSLRVGRLDDADQGLQELLRRDKEKPEPLVRYGDFLLNVKKDPMAAIEQYRQALIWRPDDDATRARIADIYIAQGIDHYGKSQWAVAEARFLDAQKYVSDPRSPQGLKIQDYMGKLRAIRQPLAR